MKILIAKHYWKNGENATWEHHLKLDKKIFEYLKENYHNFVKEKPNEIKKDGYFIYLCYEDTKDDHERDITNITFFISKSKPKEPSDLCNQKYENMELKVKSKNHTRNIILVVLAIVTIFSIGFLVINSVKKASSYTQQVVQPKEKDYSRFIDSWNEQVLNKNYRLTRESNRKLIEQLNGFVKPFYREVNSSLFDNYKQGDIKKYTQYRLENHIDKEIIFKDKMSKGEIKKSLKEITDETDMDKIVYKVLKMNEIDIFLKENKATKK